MLLQLTGNNVLVQLLLGCYVFLIYLDDTVYFSVDVIDKHVLNSHLAVPPISH